MQTRQGSWFRRYGIELRDAPEIEARLAEIGVGLVSRFGRPAAG